jgi:hypothetical protein
MAVELCPSQTGRIQGRESSTIVVTVQTGEETIEKHGVIPSNKVSAVFDMADDGKTSTPPHAAVR